MLDVVKFEKNPRLRTFMSATQLTAPSVFTNHTTLNVWGDLLMVAYFWKGLFRYCIASQRLNQHP